MQLLRLHVPDQDVLRQPALLLDLCDHSMLSAKDQFIHDCMYSLPCWHEAPQKPCLHRGFFTPQYKGGFFFCIFHTEENHSACFSLVKANWRGRAKSDYWERCPYSLAWRMQRTQGQHVRQSVIHGMCTGCCHVISGKMIRLRQGKRRKLDYR